MNHHEGIEERHESGIDSHVLEQLRALVRQPFESYQAIRACLEESHQLQGVVEHVEKLYAHELAEAQFLTKDDWEMLAALWVCDEETANHSVETYRIARNRIDRPLQLEGHSIVINLSEEFSREGVDENQFLRACLLHDIGKLAMPTQVLTNHISDSECAHILYANYDSLADKVRATLGYSPEQLLPPSAGELLLALRDAHTRPQGLVPVRLLLSGDAEREEVAGDLAHLGLSLDDSLLTIMRTHDGYSRSILTEEGLPTEAALAGAHHRHQKEYTPTVHTITIGTLQVSVDLADIIHLADVTQAMESRRHYKEPESALVVLATLVEHATHNMVDPFITFLWVADELGRMALPVDPKDEEYYTTVKKFLDTHHEVYESQLASYRIVK